MGKNTVKCEKYAKKKLQKYSKVLKAENLSE